MKLEPIRRGVIKTEQIDPAKLGRSVFTYIDISSVDKDTKTITAPAVVSVSDAPSRARKRVCGYDVLVSTVRPNLNGVALVPPKYEGEIASTGFCILRTNQDILDPYYLFYFAQTAAFIDHLTKLSIGAGYPAVADDDILDTLIPLPPLPEQQRIAAILTKADRLRRLRRYALELGESYLQSVFLEMFGDPVKNINKFPIMMFGEICETRLGKMLDEKRQTGRNKRPYLRNINVQWNRIDLSDLQEMDFDEREREVLRLRKGDVLICEGGEVGRAAIWNCELRECYYQKALHRARPNPRLATPEFIVWLMKLLSENGGLGDFTSQVTIAHLTGEKLKTIKVALPPLPLQGKFTQVVHKFERLRAQQREAVRQAEHLFQTLLHRAFAGEL